MASPVVCDWFTDVRPLMIRPFRGNVLARLDPEMRANRRAGNRYHYLVAIGPNHACLRR